MAAGYRRPAGGYQRESLQRDRYRRPMAISDLAPFVSAAWLADHLAEVVIAEVRMDPLAEDARRAYESAHLPGAVLVNVDHDLSAPAGARVGRHPLPSPDDFAQLLERLGIGASTPVVAYDSNNGALASRFVWMLRAAGNPAAVLSGGRPAWIGPTETGAGRTRPRTAVPARPWPAELLADANDVRAAIAAGTPVIDSRAPERFRGEVEPLDAIAGHIPGAVNLPFTDHYGDTGQLRPDGEIAGRFAELGIERLDGDEPAIVYCGSGVTACVNLLAAEYAGLGTGRLYVGSWSGWSTTPEAAIVVGE